MIVDDHALIGIRTILINSQWNAISTDVCRLCHFDFLIKKHGPQTGCFFRIVSELFYGHAVAVYGLAQLHKE